MGGEEQLGRAPRRQRADQSASGTPQRRSTATDDATFRSQAEVLGRWLRSSGGRLPTYSLDDGDEWRLARWRASQFAMLREGKLPQDREEYLDKVAPGWQGAPRSWQSKADELGRWLRSSGGRLPQQSADEAERQLAHWRTTQLRHFRRGELPRDREEYLEKNAPGWYRSSEPWWSVADEVTAWVKDHGALPALSAEDPQARALASWLAHQAADRRRLRRDRARWLDDNVPGWADQIEAPGSQPEPPPSPPSPSRQKRDRRATERQRDRDEKFRSTAEALGPWLHSSGDLPPHEHRRLRVWRNRQILRRRRGTLPHDHEAYLDQVAPGWRSAPAPAPAPGPTAQARFRADIVAWLQEHDDLPRPSAPDPVERRLGRLLRAQANLTRDGSAPDRAAWLDQHVPGWRDAAGKPEEPSVARRYPTREERFRSRADELGQWLRSSGGRVPTLDPDDEHERRLSSWRFRQLSLLSHGTLPPDRQEYLDQVAPGWHLRPASGRAAPWQPRADEVVAWVRQHGTLPGTSADPVERQLAEWLRNQARRRIDPSQSAWLDERLPGWRDALETTPVVASKKPDRRPPPPLPTRSATARPDRDRDIGGLRPRRPPLV